MELDKNNRVTIPTYLRELAHICPNTEYVIFIEFDKQRLGFLLPNESLFEKNVIGKVITDDRGRISPKPIMKEIGLPADSNEYLKKWTFNVEKGRLYITYHIF